MANRSKSKDKHAEDKSASNVGNYESAKTVFLWLLSAIYLFAFLSMYFQVPGLYGDKGILPARMVMKPVSKLLVENLQTKPTLVWLAPILGLDVQSTLELITLIGSFIAVWAMVISFFRNTFTFALLWALYFSIYQVGQLFTWFQWDILLLEAGFLAIVLSPSPFFRLGGKVCWSHDRISLWLVRWLLFRLMFASGVVKLTSMCPTWWQLSALSYHFESQCIPTILAYYAHHLPAWVLQLGVVGTFLIEIPIPFLIFLPIRSLQIFSFYSQILLQLAILLTGNYNFFNILTIALCFPLLDDHHLQKKKFVPPNKNRNASSSYNSIMSFISRPFEVAVIGVLLYAIMALFSVRLNPDLTVESKIAFTNQSFLTVLEWAVKGSIYIATTSLIFTILHAVYEGVSKSTGIFSKLRSVFSTFLFGAIAFWIFCISMVPHTSVHLKSNAEVWPVVRKWHNSVDQFQIVNSYGLFRRMTGVGGRPEVVIEGSNSATDGWKEYQFSYKTGNVSTIPYYIWPHQPRLDWQMWFAALGTYEENPWFVSLVNRLLNGQQEVLDLLDKNGNPFANAPPKYIRAVKYLYQYTPSNTKSRDWWTRKRVGEYLPPVTKGHQLVKQFLLKHNIITDPEVNIDFVKNQSLRMWLRLIRPWITNFYCAPKFIWGAFLGTAIGAVIAKKCFGY